MNLRLRFFALSTLLLLSLPSLPACRRGGVTEPSKQSDLSAPPAELQQALKSFNADSLLGHIKILASDQFEGRAPGTLGEEKTVQYLTEQFKSYGLLPGNPDGTYIQKVPMIGFTPTTTASFATGGKRFNLAPDDYLTRSSRYQTQTDIAGCDVVFVGYGVVAPEYGWDDFKNVDVRGKTVVMLVNDPQVVKRSDGAGTAQLDDEVFKGKAMTYYGRWTYKYEIASERGAAAAIIIHETDMAGYPLKALASWRQENFGLEGSDKGRVAVEGWITFDKAKEIFAAAGEDLASLKRSALSREFRPVAIKAKADLSVKTVIRRIESRNVIAKLEGSDPVLKNEYVVYSAHWDHMGRDTRLKGDQIFNGAIDNASGTASMLEWARAFSQLRPAPKRSILFLAVTAEEKGLLGAKYYAEHPLYPIEKTIANINKDGINQWGRTKDLTVIGLGNSTLDDTLAKAAAVQKRTLKPDAEPEKGYFYRSDHFEFAKQGVPSLNTDAGTEYIGKPAEYAKQTRDEYTEKDYHGPGDEVRANWDLTGAVEDLQLLMMVGYEVAQAPIWPEWRAGTEFKARRDKSLHSSRRQ